MNLIKKPLVLIFLVGLLAWLPTLFFWFFKGYEATWLLGVGEYNIPNLLKGHAFLYYIDWKIFGWNPWGWYLTSIVLHLIASFLLFKFVYLVSKNKLLSLIASIFFVANTSYNDVLTWGSFNSYYPLLLILMLGSLIAFAKYRGTKRKIFLTISTVFAFLGFYTRETGLVIVPMLTIFDLIFSNNLKSRQTIIDIVKRQTPFYIAFLTFFVIRSIYGGTPGDSADSNVKLQMRFVEDGLYLEYAKAAILTMGKLIPPQIIPYPALNLIRESFSKLGPENTYFFPALGWIIFGGLGAVMIKLRKSNYARIFLFFLLWLGLFSVFVSFAVPNTPEVLARAYEYNTMRYRYFAFLGTSILLAVILAEIFKKRERALVFVASIVVILNLVMLWRIEQKVYALSYKPAKEFNMRLRSFFPTLPKEAVFYLYPHSSGLGDYLLEWYLIKGDSYLNLIGEPYRIESQIIAVIDKVKKGKIELSNVFFLDYNSSGLLNETDKVRRELLNQKSYPVKLNRASEALYKSNSFEGPVVDIPYNIDLSLGISENSQFVGKSSDSLKFRALVDYSSDRINYLKTVSVSTAYTMSQREGEPFYHVLPGNLIDGNTGNRYSWIADAWNPWIQVDLGEQREIIAATWGSIDGSTRVPATYSISVSKDGREWVKAKDVKNANYAKSIDVFDKPYIARFVRMDINTTSGGDFVMLDEFEVISYSSKNILLYYKDRDKLLTDYYNMFDFMGGQDDLSYLRDKGLDTYWGKLSWETNKTALGENGQVLYFQYNINNSFQQITLDLNEGEIYSGSGNFLKKYVKSVVIDFGRTPFNFSLDSLQFIPRFKL